jgi:hypothetical protein
MLAQMPRQGDLALSLFEQDGGGALGEPHGVSTDARQSHHNHERSRRSASREGGKARWHDGQILAARMASDQIREISNLQSAICNLQ